MNFFKKRKDVALNNGEIKKILNNSRISMGEIKNRINNEETRGKIAKICDDFYFANECISSSDESTIEKSVINTVIATTKKIQEITEEDMLDQKARSIIGTIVTKTSQIRECFQSQNASAVG